MLNKILSQQSCNLRGRVTRLLMTLSVMLLPVFALNAQTGGEAGIQGTVTDSTGAAVPHASVMATNQATGVATTRESTGDGIYTISPILPGVYTVAVKATGFGDFTQKNLTVNALKLTGLNVTLAIGEQATEVTVTGAPPQLETTNATLGGVLENKTYENLPLQMSGQQRDPTSFATLLPGTQGGTRAPIIGGTGNFLAGVYVDGLPIITINQQGDNRTVSNAIPVEAIDQFQVVTSSPDAEYQGAGLINFTLRSGSNDYHGVVLDSVRARMFDAWSFASKNATCTTSTGGTIQCPKPDEHQNEFVAAGGGPIPLMKKHGFFYLTYDKYHGRSGVNPNFLTIPTPQMKNGDFSQLTYVPTGSQTPVPLPIYDPTTDATCGTVNSIATCRTQFSYNGVNNVINPSMLSPIALKMQSYLPTNYDNAGTVNNYFGGVGSGFDNWEIAGRADFDLTSKQRLSYVITYGVRKNAPYVIGGTPAGVVLPFPYLAGSHATITPVIMDVEHSWFITNSMSNQLKFGYSRFGQPQTNLTQGVSPYRAAADLGITNLPLGQASDEFPTTLFTTSGQTSGLPAETPWAGTGNSTTPTSVSGQPTTNTIPNTYTLLDNFLLTKGRHSLIFGFTSQWLEDNVAGSIGFSTIYQPTFSANSTAAIVNGTVSPTASTGPGASGFSYASFLLGAAGQSTITEQAVPETGARYHNWAPYVEDVWKVTPNLTVNLGLRWDYLQPFHEVLDRWSFLNPNITNPITGNAGALQFAGNYGGAGVSCGCRTPVQTYWKNYGPRASVAWSLTPTTVFRAGYALVYSIGGGVGGRLGAGTGTGQLGFNVNATTPTEITQTSAGTPGPSYFLNNSTGFQAKGLANTAFGGSGFVLPSLPTQNAAAQGLNTGFYGTTGSNGGLSYADPYLSGRAPEFDMYNVGIQQALTKDVTLTINYAGTQSHFVATAGSNARGYWSNQLDPNYLVALSGVADSTGKSPLLSASATPANVAILQTKLPNFQLPYTAIVSTGSKTPIAQMLVHFPQYNGITDTWGQNVGNYNYNSLQVSLQQRPSHGLSYTINYTWSRNIGDDGTFRSGFALPSGSVSRSSASFGLDRIERTLTTTDMTHNLAAYGVWEMPFGKGGFTANHFITKALFSNYQLSSIYRFTSGTPIVVTYGGCVAPSPATGTCQLDLNPNYSGNGHLQTGYRRFKTQYLDPNAFVAPQTFSTNLTTNYTKVGDAPRTAPYGLRNPYFWQDDVSLRRSFRLLSDRYHFIADVTCINIFNHPTLSNPTVAWGSPGTSTGLAFGQITGAQNNPRDFQFSGRFTF